MNSSNFRFTLDLHSVQSQYSIPAMVGDTGITLHISLTDGGVPYIINDGCLAKLSIKRPTGTYLEEFCKIKNNATIEYPFRQNENTCAVAGVHHCDVTLYSPDGTKVGGPRFTMVVSEKVVRSDDIVLTDENRTAVDNMIAAEAGRVKAEEARVIAEEERVNAEIKRVEAEAERIKVTAEDAHRAEVAANRATAAAQSMDIYEQRIFDNEKCITNHDKRIEALESGVITGFQTDERAVYMKTVPANALAYAQLEKSGVVTELVRSDNLYKKASTLSVSPPYTLGARIALETVNLPKGMYYITNQCDAVDGGPAQDDAAMLVMGDSTSRHLTLDTAQDVTIYAIVKMDWQNDYAFSSIGIYSVSYEGETVSYNGPWHEPYITTTPLKAIESKDISNTTTYTIPDSLVELQRSAIYKKDGGGGDYIDWANGQFVKHMKAIDLGSLTWTYNTRYGGTFSASLGDNISNNSDYSHILLAEYKEFSGSISQINSGKYIYSTSSIRIADHRYTDAEAFKEAMQGVILYVETKVPERIDVDTGEMDGFIKVYPSGTLTFINDKNAAIPSTVTYQLKEGE